MLRIDSGNNIYLTKGDTGSIFLTVTKDGIPVTSGTITLYVRNPNKLDEAEITKTAVNNTISFSQSDTSDLKRKKYVYDIVYTSGSNRITFIGGDVNKLGFWVT